MALATLTNLIRKDPTFKHTFTAFIVDHKLRDGSAKEAASVTESLEPLGIEPQILRLDWTGHGDPRGLSNFESVARTLRYQALGKACAAHKIPHLIFGHHADDQAETVLSRAINGYTGLGLQGIAATAPIPECAGLHGVNRSGTPRLMGGSEGQLLPSHLEAWRPQPSRNRNAIIAVEDGGVSIHRPLLRYAKKELEGICRSAGVVWHEDPTNSDKTLTIRNSIRYLQLSDVLPEALRRSSLVQTAEEVRIKKEEVQRHAQMMFEKTPIELDLRSGKATVTLWTTLQDFGDMQHTYHVRAEFVRKLLLLVSPTAEVSLQHLDQCIEMVFAPVDAMRSAAKSVPRTIQIAGVSVTCAKSAQHAGLTIILQRQAPVRLARDSMQCVYSNSGWSEWLLWDHRYWIRVYVDVAASDPDTTMHMAFLSPDSLGQLRKRYKNMKPRASSLERALSLVPDRERWIVPALVSRMHNEDRIVALPSLHWRDLSWEMYETERPRQWEIRYKNIDFPKTAYHHLIQ